MSALVPTFSQLPSGEGTLRVTTFNVLAPVWVSQGIYPGVDMLHFDPVKRRKTLCANILFLDPDVLFLQECQKTELDGILAEQGGAVRAKYDVEFCAFPLTFWTNWLTDTTNFEPRENGVAILTKRSAVQKVKAQRVPIDLPEWQSTLPGHALGAHACVVWAKAGRQSMLLATSHLDADSAYRAGLQGVALAGKIRDMAAATEGGIETIIWGGDFNMSINNAAISTIMSEYGFRAASGASDVPTVYSALGTVRVDHILFWSVSSATQGVEAAGTWLPTCPIPHAFAIFPCLDQLQWLACSTKGERGRCLQGLAVLMLLLIVCLCFPLVVIFLVMHQCDQSKRVQRVHWSLDLWGSDHLPVTVALARRGQGGPRGDGS